MDVIAQLRNCNTPGADCDTILPTVAADGQTLTTALQFVFGVLGVVALIMIVWAGFKFVTAQGEPQSVAKARQQILYAVIGLAIAVSAELIVTFVLGKL